MLRGHLLVGVGIVALVSPLEATAQTAAPSQSDPQQTSDAGIGDIIVTAQRREESVQRSSLAIDVVTGKDLQEAGVSQPADLTRIVPGLQLAQLGPTAQPYIRGVGNSSNTGAADSGVAFNVDGIYVGQPVAYGLSFYDLARIEVLKGPQGTLYGRNATGGAINLITNQPGSEFGGQATVEIGNYAQKRFTGGITIPLTSNLSVRGAFNIVDRDGYYRDGSGDDKQQAGRLRVKYAPAGFTLLASVEYGHVGGVGGGSAVVDGNLDRNPANGLEFNLVNPWAGQTDPQILARYDAASDKSRRQSNDTKVFSTSVQLDVPVSDDVTLTVLPGYRNVKQRGVTYTSGFLFEQRPYRWDQYSLEGRLAYTTSAIKAVLGGYYFKQKFDGTHYVDLQLLPPGALPPPLGTGINNTVDLDNNVESASIFGETTFEVATGFRLIGGARYTHETNRLTNRNTFTQQVANICSIAVPCVDESTAEVSANNVSWKAGAEYDVGPRSMLFATVASGFKAGGTFPANPPRNTFLPEKLLAVTVGSRNRFLDNRLQINLEGFYWSYRDKQETIGGYDSCGALTCPAPLRPGTLTNITLNSGRARVYGFSLDTVLRATTTTTLTGAVEYANSRYTSFSYNLPSQPNTGCRQIAPSGSNAFFTVDCSGMPLSRAPNWTASAGIQQTIPLGTGKVLLNGDAYYSSSRYLDARFLGNTRAPDYTLFNASVGYATAGDRLTVTAFVRNIGNETVAVTGATILSGTATLPFVANAVLQAPRTYGVRASVNF